MSPASQSGAFHGGKPLELSAQEGSEDKTASADSVLQAFDAKGKLFLCPVVDEGILDNLPLPVDEAQAVVHHLAADELPADPVDEQPVDKIVPLIEVDSPHHCLEGIAVDVFLGDACTVVGGNDPRIEPQTLGKRIERLPRNDL